MTELQKLLATVDELPLDELDDLQRRIEERRAVLTRLKERDPRRQTQEAVRIREEVNNEIDQALELARRYHRVAKV